MLIEIDHANHSSYNYKFFFFIGEQLTMNENLFEVAFERLCATLNDEGSTAVFSRDFATAQTNEDRILLVWNSDKVNNMFTLPELQLKSTSIARAARCEGNEFFKKRKYEAALEAYTRCVAAAPSEEGSELSLAFANRSACLHHMDKLDACLQDISYALHCGYPEELCYKLHFRAGKCLLAQGEIECATNSFDDAKMALTKAQLDAKYMQQWNDDITKALSECELLHSELNGKSTVTNNAKSTNKSSIKAPKICANNPVYSSLTNICSVEQSAAKGRHIVALRDITPGEIIVVEKPYASVLLPQSWFTHCHNCLRRCIAPIPCLYCRDALFCSVSCRQQAWHTYHEAECGILNIINISGIGKFGFLAMRTVVLAKKGGLLKMLSTNESCVSNGFSSEYERIYNLVAHSDDRSAHDLFRRSLMAMFLIKCLTLTEFCDSMNETEISLVGGHLLHHLQMLPCNAHEISELKLDRLAVATSCQEEIGAGIYATLSLFNHSCDPSVTRNFYGTKCVMRAIKTIRKGEEVSDNYGVLYAVHSKEERQTKLHKQYYFDCSCNACCNDWPLYGELILNEDNPQWKCSKCFVILLQTESRYSCPICKQSYVLNDLKQRLVKAQRDYEEAFNDLLKCNTDKSLPVFSSYLSDLDQLLMLPWKDYNNGQEAIKQCFGMLGNCYTVN